MCFIFFLSILCFSCNHPSNQNLNSPPVNKEKLIDLNKQRISEENDLIDAYISRHNYEMQTTETGLRYKILKEGDGANPKWMTEVKLNYNVELLDGTYCYSSDSSGALQIQLGKSDEPTGLQEGILKMKEGGTALLIVPSYLAFGLTGDGDKIPGGQSLVYHIELMEVK